MAERLMKVSRGMDAPLTQTSTDKMKELVKTMKAEYEMAIANMTKSQASLTQQNMDAT